MNFKPDHRVLILCALPSLLMSGCSSPMGLSGTGDPLLPSVGNGPGATGPTRDRQPGRQVMEGNPNVTAGLRITPVGVWGLRVDEGTCLVAGKPVAVAHPTLLTESAPEAVAVQGEAVALADAGSGPQGSVLRGVINDGAAAPSAMDPASLKVWTALGTGRQILRKDVDFTVDPARGELYRKVGGAIPAGGTVYVDYQVRQVRLDTIEVKQDGSVELKKGASARTAPIAAAADPNSLPLARVFLDYGAARLTREAIYDVGSPYPEPSEAERKAMASVVAHTRGKLQGGDPVTIVFWGDDAVGGPAGSQVSDRLTEILDQQFKGARIKLVNAGAAGSTIESRLPSLQQDVLSHHPDLVVVESVSDMQLPAAVVKKDYTTAVEQMKAAGSEVVLTTPHPTAQPGSRDLRGKDGRADVEVIRSVARAEGVGLADVARRWEHLAEEGTPYTALLSNGIDQVDDRGRQIYAETVGKFF